MRDDLFQLVKSLSKNEKRYFTLQASTHRKEARHLFLFQAIDKQKEYDEAALRKLFREKGFTEQISVAKNYLYSLILKTLRSYHSSLTVNTELKEMLRNMELLFSKGLYDQCERVLNKAAAIAKSNSIHHHMIEINMWRQNLLVNRKAATKSRDQLLRAYRDIQDEMIWITDDYQMVHMGRYAFSIMAALSPFNNQADLMQVREMMPEIIINGEINANASYIARVNFLYARITYFRLNRELVMHRRYSGEFIDLVTGPEGPAVKNGSHTVGGYDHVLWNFCYSEQFDEAAKILPLMEKAVYSDRYNARPSLQAPLALHYHSFRLTVLSGLGDFQKAVTTIPKILRHLKKYDSYIEPQQTITLHFNIASAYFGAGDFKNALRWLEGILNTGSAELAFNHGLIYSMSRIFQLLLHFELGNQELLEYLLKSYYRFLARKENRYRTEEAVLRCMRRILKLTDRRRLNGELGRLVSELRPLRYEPFEQEAFQIFDPMIWAESRIEGKEFAEIVKRNARQRKEQEIATAFDESPDNPAEKSPAHGRKSSSRAGSRRSVTT
ncbi:MAG: hypothetical protein JWQ98_2543 [Chlorobi bacterium]|nr:hypothetical protein [Chlorobiota bacterium]